LTRIERLHGVEIVAVDRDRRAISYLRPDGAVWWIHDASAEMLQEAEQALKSNRTVTLVIKEEGGLGGGWFRLSRKMNIAQIEIEN
jgi:hypothetical protein